MKTAAKTIIVVSILGFLNSLYLTALFIKQKFGESGGSICDISNKLSCSNVVSSQYSQFFGVPVCTIALLVYPILILLGYMALKKRSKKNYFYGISVLSAMGLMLNVVYIYNEVKYIGILCILCLLCSVFIATDLIMSIRGYFKSPNT